MDKLFKRDEDKLAVKPKQKHIKKVEYVNRWSKHGLFFDDHTKYEKNMEISRWEKYRLNMSI